VAEALELGDEPAGLLEGVEAGEVVAAGVVVDLAGGEDVPAGDDDRVFEGADRAFVSAPGAQPPVLGVQVRVAAARVGLGGLGERDRESWEIGQLFEVRVSAAFEIDEVVRAVEGRRGLVDAMGAGVEVTYKERACFP